MADEPEIDDRGETECAECESLRARALNMSDEWCEIATRYLNMWHAARMELIARRTRRSFAAAIAVGVAFALGWLLRGGR